MAYRIYLGEIMFPVAPGKLELKIKNKNQTIELIDGSETLVLEAPGLSELSFEVLLPATAYGFAVYPQGFQPPAYYLQQLEKLKVNRLAAELVVQRVLPDSARVHDTNMTVALQDYTVTDNVQQGVDTLVKLNLKQYVQKSTNKADLITAPDGTLSVRFTESRPVNVVAAATHVAQPGETLWHVAKKCLGDGAKWTVLAALNAVTNPVALQPGQVIRLR